MAKDAKGTNKPEKPVKKMKRVVIRETLMERAADMIHEGCNLSGLVEFLLSDEPITREDREDIAGLLGHNGGWQGVKVEVRRTRKAMPSKARQRMRLFRYVNAIKREHDGEMPPEAWDVLAEHFKRSPKAMRNAYSIAQEEHRRFFVKLDARLSKVSFSSDD